MTRAEHRPLAGWQKLGADIGVHTEAAKRQRCLLTGNIAELPEDALRQDGRL